MPKPCPGNTCCEPPWVCGCGNTQMRVDISNADDVVQIFGARFSPGPCDFLNYAGFSVVDGTYYITWPSSATIIELGRWASTTGKLSDAFGNYYCCYLKIEFQATSGSLPCGGFLIFTIHLEFLADPADPCPDVDDVIFGSTYEDQFGVGVFLCETDSDTIEIQTVTGINAVDCGAKYWTCDVDVSPA